MNKYNNFITKALNKMFQAVGFEKFDESFAKQENWYTMKTWTLEQETEFKKWFLAEAKKDLKMNKIMVDKEYAWFNLKWGWKTAE